MRLSELEPEWLKWTDDHHFSRVSTRAEADGIFFVCPKCFAANGNQRPGVHGVITSPGLGRWQMIGDSFENLTLVAGSSSVHLTGPGCGAHFFIRNGNIDMC